MEHPVKDLLVSENSMVAEGRMARLESDIGELKSDVKSLNARVTESIISNAKEFGGLRTEIESAKLWILVTGVGSVILMSSVSFLGRALKLF
jgi:hypothetical protein